MKDPLESRLLDLEDSTTKRSDKLDRTIMHQQALLLLTWIALLVLVFILSRQ